MPSVKLIDGKPARLKSSSMNSFGVTKLVFIYGINIYIAIKYLPLEFLPTLKTSTQIQV